MSTPPILDKLFELKERETSVHTEVIAGVTTFFTLSYIVFVNPAILSSAGMDFHSVYVATCVAAAFGCLLMGLWANYPIALAPGMGLNAYFATVLVLDKGIPWQVALGAVFCSGVLFMILSYLPVREWILNSIPKSQKLAIASGIGLFLVFLALQSAGIIQDNPVNLVQVGDLTRWSVLLVLVGFVVILALENRKIPGGILGVILVISIISWVGGISDPPTGVVAIQSLHTEAFLSLDILGALEIGLLVVIFSFLLVDLFDTNGTLVALLGRFGMMSGEGKIPKLRRALLADSSATVVGSLMGTSTTTSYIESASGMQAGGKTGLTAVIVGLLMLLMLLFEPLAGAIPAVAVAPAILFVGCIMVQSLQSIDWDDLTEIVPAVVTAISIPLTFSIATGIGTGFICYVMAKLFSGKISDIHPAMAIIAGLFMLKFVFDL